MRQNPVDNRFNNLYLNSMEETREKKEKLVPLRKALIGAVVLFILPFFILAIYTLSAPENALIHLEDSSFRYAETFTVMGGQLAGRIDNKTYENRKKALDGSDRSFSWKILPLERITRIEIIHPADKKKEEDKEAVVPARYLGTWKVRTSGHTGYLYIWKKEGRVRGAIKFPDWANGVAEPLRGLTIKNNSIYFVRSATSAAELRRLGASSYFVQKYYGNYLQGGKIIKGYYISNGVRNVWRAERVR
jgi:hypothetical protein